MIERYFRSELDQHNFFPDLTDGQFEELVSTLEKFYKEKPEGCFSTIKNLATGRLTLSKLDKIQTQKFKDINRIKIISRISTDNIEDKRAYQDTYIALQFALYACIGSEDYSTALQNFNRNLWNYQDSHRVGNIGKQSRLGNLAVRICMEQKQFYW